MPSGRDDIDQRASSDHAPSREIQIFWQWFETIAADLGKDFDDPALLGELDRRVSELGDVSWEIGPGLVEECALVITPDGSKDQLATSRSIVESAPQIRGWEFHWAKPPKRWEKQFEIESDRGGVIPVDARSWRYVLFRFPDGTFDVILEQSNLAAASEGDRYTAAVVLLDGILGELRRLELIGGIEAVAALPKEQEAKASPIDVLSKHLESLVAKP